MREMKQLSIDLPLKLCIRLKMHCAKINSALKETVESIIIAYLDAAEKAGKKA